MPVFAVSDTVVVAGIAALGPIMLALLTFQYQARRDAKTALHVTAEVVDKVQEVHLLVDGRLDKVLAANEALVKTNEVLAEKNARLAGTVADLNTHILQDAGAQPLSAGDTRAVEEAQRVPPPPPPLAESIIIHQPPMNGSNLEKLDELAATLPDLDEDPQEEPQ